MFKLGVKSFSVFSVCCMLGGTMGGAGSALADEGTQNLQTLHNLMTIAEGPDKGTKVPLYDGTIEKYNGYYYEMGTGTMGRVYRSKDMIHWEPSYVLASQDPSALPPYADDIYSRYGASDLYYHNGVMFYGFNGNNLIAGDPSTMNTKPDFKPYSMDHQYDDGIDLQFFVAANGDLVYIRKVQPDEPNPNDGSARHADPGAWMWNVKSFFDEKGNPDRSPAKQLVHMQKGQWANVDKFNFEGPEMEYHDGQYYLLYVGNNMSPRTGLYETGVAQGDSYDQIGNGDKYPGKLLARNLEQMILEYKVVLPTAEHGGVPYTYTFTQPDGDWNSAEYDDSAWTDGEGGFGFPLKDRNVKIPSISNDGKTVQSDIWGTETGPQTLWTRRDFTLTSVPQIAALRVRMEGYGKIYINGQEVASQEGLQPGYKMIQVPDGLLRQGKNVVAAEITRDGPSLSFYHLDYGLYDTNGQPVEDDIVGPSQPNMIVGPNGFENWITYKAFWNGVNGQGKDRVYFWDGEMVADGPTSATSPDMHFDAEAPTFQDDFETTDSMNHYTGDVNDSKVAIEDGALHFQAPDEQKQVLLKDEEVGNLYLETNIRFADGDFGSQARAGIIVWQKDADNSVKLLIDRERHSFIVETTLDGQTTSKSYDLPDSFQFHLDDPRVADYKEQYHTLRIYKNGSRLFAQLDHYYLNNDQPVLDLPAMSTLGKVGLVSDGANCTMDNVTLTTGWHEYNQYINGWDANWTVADQGITSPASGENMTVKGDPVRQYEFSANINAGSLPSSGKAGLVLEYVDDRNYVAGYTNYATGQFEIHQITDGQDQLLKSVSAGRDSIYGYSHVQDGGQTDYEFDLRGETEVSAAKMLWFYGNYSYLGTTFMLPNGQSPLFGMDYWDEDTQQWAPIPLDYTSKGRGDYSIAAFDSKVKTSKLRLRVPAKINRPFTFAAHEDVSAQNFYRTVRKDGKLYMWVNNRLIFTIDDPFGTTPARVGLYTEDVGARFNSLTDFEVGRFPADTTAPVTGANIIGAQNSGNVYPSGTVVKLEAEDSRSPVIGTYYSLDGAQTWNPYHGSIPLKQSGLIHLDYYSVDAFHNKEAIQTLTLTRAPDKPAANRPAV